MTSEIDYRSRRARAFTLVELLLVIGIIGLLMGLLLPAVSKAYGRSVRLRTQADLAAITTALEAYKADFGSYPPVVNGNSGAAALGKALIGSADAAHFWDTTTQTLSTASVSTTALNAPPPTFTSGTTYQAGDIVTTGAALTLNDFLAGTQSSIFVCVRNNTQADGTTRTPTGNPATDFWWALFLPYDGNDGAGSKIRLGAAPDSNGRLTTAVGKVYGPYVDVDRFKTRGVTLLDRYGSPILYFPINTAADPLLPNGLAAATGYPAPANVRAMVNVNDNIGAFLNERATSTETSVEPAARVQMMLGDMNLNGKCDSSAATPENRPPKVAFLLWTAGADGRFGPAGENRTSASDWRLGDIMTAGNSADAPGRNRLSVEACDDVTNFQSD